MVNFDFWDFSWQKIWIRLSKVSKKILEDHVEIDTFQRSNDRHVYSISISSAILAFSILQVPNVHFDLSWSSISNAGSDLEKNLTRAQVKNLN